MTKRRRQAIAVGLLAGCVVIIGLTQIIFGHNSSKAIVITNCQRQLGTIKFRSQLLSIYKQNQDDQYSARRDKSATLISYAGQWVPKDATSARDSLYKYDALHAATDNELNKQIKGYKYLETSSLDCSDAQRANLNAKLAETRGLKNGKVVGGSALINQDKQKEIVFVKKDLLPDYAALLTKLHQQKAKQPKPTHAALFVKSS